MIAFCLNCDMHAESGDQQMLDTAAVGHMGRTGHAVAYLLEHGKQA